MAEPGIPAERAAALRKAFMDTMNDPAFLADMSKRNLIVEPLSGEEVQKLIASAVATPRELVEHAKRYVGGRQQMIIDWHTHVHSLREQAHAALAGASAPPPSTTCSACTTRSASTSA